jgi:uncharacterized membrane protein
MEMSIPTASVFTRLSSIDTVRGLIMVVMALDHTRDYFHVGALTYDPTDLTVSPPSVFLTRWITHFCAPAFLFLSGLSASLKRSRTAKRELSQYLFTRGLWLMLLDITLHRFSLLFNFYYLEYNMLSILWLIGGCMVIMSAVIYFRHWAILAVAMLIIFGHNLTDGLAVPTEHPLYIPWILLWTGGLFQLGPGILVYSIYAIIPWLGIMMLGYFVGRWYGSPYTDKMRRRLLVYTGILSIILFLFFRYTGFYGDPRPALDFPDALTTFLSFLNVSKYPVSLQFTLMTLGPIMILLAYTEKLNAGRLTSLIVFGRVPLFYFLVHFYVIHIAALVFYMIRTGKTFSSIDFHFPASFGGITAEGGVSLLWTYVAWVLIIVLMYPMCLWFERYKREAAMKWVQWF